MLLEQKDFEVARADYLRKIVGNTKKHESYYSFMPYLPKEFYDETCPIDAKDTFKISDKGYVTAEKIEAIANKEATEFIEARLAE